MKDFATAVAVISTSAALAFAIIVPFGGLSMQTKQGQAYMVCDVMGCKVRQN